MKTATSPAAHITTASDGTWDLTSQDLRTLILANHTNVTAFTVATSPVLSRKLPTSVVDRVWGMLDRGELNSETVDLEGA